MQQQPVRRVWRGSKKAIVNVRLLRDEAGAAEAFAPGERGCGPALAKASVIKHELHCGPKIRDASIAEDKAVDAIAHDLATSARVTRDHRHADRQRLHRADRHSLAPTRENQRRPQRAGIARHRCENQCR